MLNKRKLLGKIVEAGFNQRTLAHELNMSINTLSAKINGRSQFNTCEIDKVCDALQIADLTDRAEIFLSKPSHMRDNTA